MIKKYFKYILLTFTVMFLFQLDTFAKAELVNMNMSEVKSNSCEYEYNGYIFNIYSMANGTVGIKKSETLPSGYNYVYISAWDDSQFANNKCPRIYIYNREWYDSLTYVSSKELYIWFEEFVPDDIYNGSNEEYTYLATKNGNQKKLTTSCVYEAEGSKFTAEIDPITDSTIFSVSGVNNDEGIANQIKGSAKKKWKHNDTGLVCRDDIVMDVCGFFGSEGEWSYKINVRTTADKMDTTCTKSTSPGGIKVTEKDTESAASKLLFLSDICEEDAGTMKVVRFIGYVLVIVKILIPIGLIIIGVINFSKAMLSGNDDSIKKNAYSFAWKIVFAIVIFVLPTVINFIVGLIDGATDGTEDYENCRNCIFDPKNCDIPNE